MAALAGERVVVAKEGGYNLADCDQYGPQPHYILQMTAARALTSSREESPSSNWLSRALWRGTVARRLVAISAGKLVDRG